MKRVYSFFSLLLFSAISFAQCGGSCPAGALTTLPASGTIPAGTTYCISGTVSNSTNYTISGTLIVQSGTLSIGTVTLNKTGSIVVATGARLSTSNFTGESMAPASIIPNITVCTGGFLGITGAFNQWETNIVLNNYAVLLVTGSWTSSSTDIYAKIGMGALVEMCGSLNINTNGFFIETTSGPSYLVTIGGATQSAVGGWLSTKQGASLVKWTSISPTVYFSYPAANTCNACGNNSLTPPGITPAVGSCVADANSYIIAVLPISIHSFYEQVTGEVMQLIAELDGSFPVQQVTLESSGDGHNFETSSYTAMPAVEGNMDKYVFTLPLQESGKYYRVRARSGESVAYSQVLSTARVPENRGGFVFPDPAISFVYLSLKANNKYTDVCLISNTGQVLQRSSLPPSVTTYRFDLPSHLSTGIYFIKVTGPGDPPLVSRVLKN